MVMKYIFAIIIPIILIGCSSNEKPNAERQDDKLIDSHISAGYGNTGFIEIIEFTPITEPDKQCVFVKRYDSGGLQCWDKKHD